MHCTCGIQSREECQVMHDIALIKEIENNEYSMHRMRSFVYGLQHPDIYLVSAKTFATNLIGVCIATEYNNDQRIFNMTLKKISNVIGNFEVPPMLKYLGNLNISHIINAKDGLEYELLVKEWAEDVWKAYAAYHHLAYSWIHMAE